VRAESIPLQARCHQEDARTVEQDHP
jgi:hypothetical protein